MKDRQKTALDNHCRFAFETAQDKFCARTIDGASVVLTVNSGYE